MAEFIEVLSEESKKDIKNLVDQLEKVAKNVNVINKAFKGVKVPSQASKTVERTRRSTKALNAEQREAQRLARTLAREKAKLNRANGIQAQGIQRLRFENRKANKLAKERAIMSSKLATAYEKQQVELTQLTRKHNDLSLKQANGNKLTREERRVLKRTTKEIQRKDAALKKVDSQVGKYTRNVGNYKSAWRGVAGILRTTVAAFGIYSAMDIGRQIFKQIKLIDSLDLALKKVTKSAQEYAQANIFLSHLAERSGSDINRLQRAYVKFLAAAQTTNLTLEETQEIFENVSVAGAVLGQSSEDVEGALRALEQMLSKGKVQAEEIRGQLGERLPGAYQILAKSIGMTTEELSKQLELGNVYADEVLPKFARELARAFSLDNIDKVNTLTAAQGRLTNAWIEFLKTVEDGGGRVSKTLTGIFDALTGTVDFFTEFNKSYKKSMEEARYGVGEFVKTWKEGIKDMSEEDADMAIQDKVEENQRSIEGYRRSLGELAKKQASTNYFDVVGRIFQPNKLHERSRAILKNIAQLEEFNKLILGTADAEEEKNDVIEDGNKKSDNKNTILEGTIAFYEQLIKKLEEEMDTTVTSREEWVKYEEKVTKAKDSLRELIRTLHNMEDQNTVLELDSEGLADTPFDQPNIELQEYLDKIKEADENTKALLQYLKEELQKDIFSGEFASLGRMLNIDTTRLENSFKVIQDEASTTEEKIMAMAESIGEIMGGLGQTLMQNELIRIDNLITANQKYYQEKISAAKGDAEVQELLRKEQEQKRRKLEARRAQEQKKAAKFDILTNTAVAIIKTFANLGFPAGIPAAAAIGALGAAKVALVESRPIPQYKDGRKGGKEEYAVLGDGYREEAIIGRDGKLKGISPDKPTMMHLDKGDSVIPSLDHNIARSAILDSISMNSGKMNQSNDVQNQIQQLRRENSSVKKDIIKSLKKANFINQNSTRVDLGHQFKKLKYQGK